MRMTRSDELLAAADAALRTLFATPHAARACPTLPGQATELSTLEKSQAGALMRVNHVGEVCAQAMYAAQAQATKNPALRSHFEHASLEETDTLPGPGNGWTNWAAGPRCSTRCGMPVPSAWACWPGAWGTR